MTTLSEELDETARLLRLLLGSLLGLRSMPVTGLAEDFEDDDEPLPEETIH